MCLNYLRIPKNRRIFARLLCAYAYVCTYTLLIKDMKHPSVFSHMTTKLVAAIVLVLLTTNIWAGNKFRIGDNYFQTLEDALAYANNDKHVTNMTILALEDYTLPAGNYTLPAKATLVIPCHEQQTDSMGTVTVATENYIRPSAFRTLTFAEGVNLNVYGKIEVSGRIYSAQPELSVPSGTYGHLVMNAGSHVTLNSGAFMQAYGFVTGEGEILVNNGADTQELFQVMDWKGGVASATIAGVGGGEDAEDILAKKVFIVNQYYFQSIEVPTVYRAGSHAYGMLNVQVYGNINIDTRVMVVGLSDENAMFKMDEDKISDRNVWVRKRYDAVHDQQVYEINSSAYLGSMVINAMGFAFNSADYVLPITSNFKIHVLSGYMGITERTLLLPGATIEVDKQATAYIDEERSLYVCDHNDWDKYVYAGGENFVYGTHVRYTPDWGTSCPRACNTLDDLGDATINVHGTFDVLGKLLTTQSGANIFSTNEDAGTISFYTTGTTENELVWQVQMDGFHSFTCVPAILRNEDNTTTSISGAAEGTSYCYYDNRWRTMFIDEDNPMFVYDNYGDYYAKPSDYVPLQAYKMFDHFVGNDDHTFSSLDGKRLFILRDADSQWWEVTIQNNYYYCPKNGKYYYYDEDEEDWKEKTFTVTWKNFDGTTLHMSEDPIIYAEYQVVYGTVPEYLGSTPTREATADYTYDFIGWTPEITAVTSDIVYTAKYQETQRKYTVIFLNENGGEIERHFYALGDMPECDNTPQKGDLEKTYTLIWEPAIGAVNGDQTYRATFVENAPTEYTIRFVNYDGTELQSSSVAVNTMPAYTGQTPTKPSTFDDDFTFSGWSPQLKPVDGAITYTATFDKTKKTYAIRFFESDGTTQIGATQNLDVGATPQVPAYAHNPQPGHTFTLYWTPAVGTVTGNQDYVGNFTDEISRYAVTLVAPHATVWGAGVYEYNENDDAVEIDIEPDENYTFVHWLNENGVIVSTDPSFTTSVTANRTFTAVLNGPVTYTVAYKGNGATKGSTMSSKHICGVDQNLTLNGFSRVGYTFAGWNTAADGTGTSFTDGQTVRDLSLVQESTVNLYAQWTPRTDIAYTVEYFRESANGTYPDNPYESVAKSDGTADAQKTITPEKSYTGYDTPAAQSVTIAANGTTIVKFYYTRATVVVVAYTVKHYQQNLADDLYTLIDTDNLQTNANSSVTPATKSYTGFTAPATQTVTVVADGSTVVEYYYTRNTYTVTFRDDNNTLQTSQVKHGATPSYIGATPTKDATAEYTYTFSTWSPAVAVATAAATYTATFTQAANSYTISWVTDGDPLTGNYTNGLTAYGTTIVAPVPTKTGYTFAGWNPALPSSMPAEDVTYTATWTAAGNTAYTVKHYQQNLNDDQYTLIDTDNLVGETDAQVTPAVKSYVGFTAPATQTKTITADGQLLIEYYYTRNKYLITFKDGNNAVLQTSQVKYGATPQYEGTAPQKAASAEYSYTWTGAWTPAIEPATAAATYTATFTQTANTYTITWITDGDALTGNYTTGSVAYGTKIVQPNMPTKAGATFAGWTPSVPGTMPAADISFTATFVTTSDAVYYVRYNAPGATGSMLVSSHVLGAPSRLNKNTFVRTGYVFLGWTTGRTAGVEYADEAEITDLTTVPNAIVQLYACWSFEAAVLYDAPTAGQTLQQAADALQMQLTNLRQSCEDNPDLRCDVTIHRTLRHDGSLQPICLPFSVAAVDINDPSNPLYQAAIYSYDYRVKTVSSTVDVMIRRVNHIIAGVPYLIKFQSGFDQQKLEFHGVRFTADNALIEESAPMNYVGALLPEAKVSGQNVLYVGDNNQLEWWNGEGETYLRGFRGFFQLNASGQRSIRRGMVVNLIEQEDDAQKETPTGMDENQNQNEEVKKVIIDNQLYIIRRGTYYNALGTPVYMEIIMDM